MELFVYSPQETKTFSIAWIELQTPTGSYTIQPGHAPTILILSPGKMINFRLKNGKHEELLVNNGIAQIDRKTVKILLS